jgi:hypothetical protein
MPRSAAPEWRRRKEPILDHLLHASVAHVNGVYHPETGHYGELVYAGCPTRDRAKEIKQALFRAGKHTGHSVTAWIVANGDAFDVHFKAIDKTKAREYMLQHYGSDRSKWPYSPYKRDINYNT